MNRRIQALGSLTVASVKMYYRNVAGLFFTLFVPVMLVVIFGLLNSGKGGGGLKLSLTNNSDQPLAMGLVEAIKKVEAFKVEEVSQADGATKLGKGQTDLQVVIPENFGQLGEASQLKPASIQGYYNEGRPQQGQTAGLILGQIVSGLNSQLTRAPQLIGLETSGIKTNNLGVIDFLLPGILAMSIMQLGIFSVSFGFISYKTSGALRRLQATPTHPINFIFGQSIARIIIGVIQMGLLLGLGIGLFHMHLVGSVVSMLVLATLGTIVFLAIGFTIAGWARDEQQAAPLANLVSFPMLFLSGVFFPRDGLPEYLKTITNYLPLTYLADALRRVANEGASLWTIKGDLMGLIVWGMLMFFVAVRTFKWE